MKNFLIGFGLFVFGGAIAQQNFVKFEAHIANRNSDSLMVVKDGNFVKLLLASKEGVFKDTLNAETGSYMLYDGKESTGVFFKNGYDLVLKVDAKQFDETIVYSGKGAEANNFLAKYALENEKYDYQSLLKSSTVEEFDGKLDKKYKADLLQLESAKLDADFVKIFKTELEQGSVGIKEYFEGQLALGKLNGQQSPNFEFENHKGGKTKLEDLRGKYVYIDIWATWCAPCRQEIPFLQKLEEQFHGKNIEFVSLSIDEKKDYEKWKKFVADKNLGGIQLYADNGWQSEFVQQYHVSGIPRFILIDPTGKIVNSNEERPSSPTIAAKFEALLK